MCEIEIAEVTMEEKHLQKSASLGIIVHYINL